MIMMPTISDLRKLHVHCNINHTYPRKSSLHKIFQTLSEKLTGLLSITSHVQTSRNITLDYIMYLLSLLEKQDMYQLLL